MTEGGVPRTLAEASRPIAAQYPSAPGAIMGDSATLCVCHRGASAGCSDSPNEHALRRPFVSRKAEDAERAIPLTIKLA